MEEVTGLLKTPGEILGEKTDMPTFILNNLLYTSTIKL